MFLLLLSWFWLEHSGPCHLDGMAPVSFHHSNLMKPTLALILISSGSLCRGAEYNFSGDLSSQFTAAGDLEKTFQQRAGRAIYHNSGATGAGNTEVLIWNPVQPRADQSWTLSADLTIPLLAAQSVGGPEPEIFAEIGFACLFGNSNFSAGLQQGFLGDSLKRIVISETETDGDELFDPFPDVNGVGELLTGDETVRLTIQYQAENHTLTTRIGGIVLFAVDIENNDAASGSSNQTDWGMSATSTFTIGIFGSSSNYPVAPGRPLQLDNLSFTLSDSPAAPLTLELNQQAVTLVLGANAGLAPVEIQTSDNLVDWFTIHTTHGLDRFSLLKDGPNTYFRAVR